MAELGFTINPEEAANDFYVSKPLLPPGWTDLIITDEKDKPTKGGIARIFTIENRAGQSINIMYNFKNANENTQRQALGAFGQIALAVGWNRALTNTDCLHGKWFQGEIIIKESINKDGTPQLNDSGNPYPPKNEIVKYRPIQKSAVQSGNKEPMGF